jgi:hypothetical protein
VLRNEKIDIVGKIDASQEEEEAYLSYVYSNQFVNDVTKKLNKVYDSLYGLFTGEECQDFIADIIEECKKQISAYESIKNASMRVRRAVLGEIRERKEGGLYYTKPFRELMNCILDIEDFFNGTLKSDRAKIPEYFYRQMMSFYKSAAFVVRNVERIVLEAEDSLGDLHTAIEKEISDLLRFKQKVDGQDVYLYADRIKRRREILEEIYKVKERVVFIGESNTAFIEFCNYLKGEKNFIEVGGSGDFVDLIRYLPYMVYILLDIHYMCNWFDL